MGPKHNAFLVWGSGGHGRVVADLIRALGHEVVGFVDRDPDRLGARVELGDALVSHRQDELLAAIRENGRYPEGVNASAMGIGDNALRLACLHNLDGLAVPPLVHSLAAASPGARLGRGTVVLAGAVINVGARIGEAVIINSGSVIEHDCILGDGVHVSPGATLCGAVRVGERSWIGAGATVIHEITVGPDSVVGAGSTVIQNVPAGVTVVGTPARIIVRPSPSAAGAS